MSFEYNRAEGEHQYLSGAGAVRHLVDVVSRGGRLLLNVGPKVDGKIPCEQRECLERMGVWNGLYGPELRAIRAVSASDSGEARVRLLGHGEHVAVVVDALISQVYGLPQGFDYSCAAVSLKGALCTWGGQSLHVQAGENLPRDARGEARPIVITAPSA